MIMFSTHLIKYIPDLLINLEMYRCKQVSKSLITDKKPTFIRILVAINCIKHAFDELFLLWDSATDKYHLEKSLFMIFVAITAILTFTLIINAYNINRNFKQTFFEMSPTSPFQSMVNQFKLELFISGTAAGIAKTLASPIQVVKIRLQLQQALLEKQSIQNPYSGMINCFKRLYLQQGFKAYYKGNLAHLMQYCSTQALNFAIKNYYSKLFASKKSKGTQSFTEKLVLNMFYGSAAGASTQFFVYPLDYIRTRLTNDIQLAKTGAQRQFEGILDCAKKTYSWDGLRGLYRGFVVSCVFMMIYRGIYFGLNDSVKPALSPQIVHNLFYNFLISYTITVVSGIISYPLDTVRRRMMMSSGETNKFNSSIACMSQMYKEHGMKSFYGGVAANVIRGVTGAGVLTIYDFIQHLFFGKKYTS